MHSARKIVTTVVLCLCAALLVTSCFGVVPGALEQEGTPENHFVIMYDMSWSMDNADDRLKGMVADFLLKVPSQLFPYKIAIIPFAGKCPQTDILKNGESDWWDIQTANGQNRETIKTLLAGLEYTGSYTDIEQALQQCAKTLNAMRSDGKACNQIVLFITDGVIDVPGDATNSVRSRIANIISSAERIPDIAEEFPNDCRFWAIVPDDLSKSAIITSDDDGNILTYYGKTVEEDQRNGICAALTCLDDFCSRLNMLGPEGMNDRAGTIPMNWTEKTLQNFRVAYTSFFESIWDTVTITKEQVDLSAGFEFSVPDGTAEVNITVMPEIEDATLCEAAAEQLLDNGMLSVTKDGLPQAFECEGSIYTVNVKLVDPPTGKYYLKTAGDKQYRFTLDFLTYNDLHISMLEQNITRALGSTVLLEGCIIDPQGTLITAQTEHNLILEACVSDESGNEWERPAVELDTGRFRCSFTASHVGDNYLTLYMTYDDTNDPQDPSGISKFGHQERVVIEVPEVSYRGEAVQHFLPKVSLILQPYSEISGEQTDITAETTKKYLNDDWVLQLLDEQGAQIDTDTPMQISEDGTYFVLECESGKAGSAVMVNRTTGMSIKVPIERSFINVFTLSIGAIIFAVVAVIVLVVLLYPAKITATFRSDGETVTLYLNANGQDKTGMLAGSQLTARYDKKKKQVVARLNGWTKRANVVGRSCDIDF